ncbi:MAG TPA: hypothetical protein VIV60_08110, partial [Polyangiaceae bacterium]
VSGLKPGDQVIVAGSDGLSDGAKVRVRQPGPRAVISGGGTSLPVNETGAASASPASSAPVGNVAPNPSTASR